MASRRYEREGSGFAQKFVTWVIAALIIVWASRNPHQAAAIVHYIAATAAQLASHYGVHAQRG